MRHFSALTFQMWQCCLFSQSASFRDVRRLWCQKVAQGATSKRKKKEEICIMVACTIMITFLSISTTSTKMNCKLFLANYCRFWAVAVNILYRSKKVFDIPCHRWKSKMLVPTHDQPQLLLTGCNSTDELPSVRLLRRRGVFNQSQIMEGKKRFLRAFFLQYEFEIRLFALLSKELKTPSERKWIKLLQHMWKKCFSSLQRKNLRQRIPTGTHQFLSDLLQ